MKARTLFFLALLMALAGRAPAAPIQTFAVKYTASSAGIALVSSSNGGAQTSSASIPAPASVVAGNLLYAVVVHDQTGTTNAMASTGSTQRVRSAVFNTNNDNAYISSYYKIATGSVASYTFGGVAAIKTLAVGIMQFSGQNASTPFPATATTRIGAASTTAVYPSITTIGSYVLITAAAQAGNFNNSVSNSLTRASYSVGVNSVSQYNLGPTNYDSESVFGSYSPAPVAAGANTPASDTFNTSYKYGALTDALNPQ